MKIFRVETSRPKYISNLFNRVINELNEYTLGRGTRIFGLQEDQFSESMQNWSMEVRKASNGVKYPTYNA